MCGPRRFASGEELRRRGGRRTRGSRGAAGGRRGAARGCRARSWPGRVAARGGSSSAVLIGSTRPGSSPAAVSTTRANSYQLTAPWLVTCQVPGSRSIDERRAARPRGRRRWSGEPRWSVTKRIVPFSLREPQDRLHHVRRRAGRTPTTCARPRSRGRSRTRPRASTRRRPRAGSACPTRGTASSFSPSNT